MGMEGEAFGSHEAPTLKEETQKSFEAENLWRISWMEVEKMSGYNLSTALVIFVPREMRFLVVSPDFFVSSNILLA
ncbi:hypothetical protein V6N13_035123 [Hibiscus sabdariffa]